MRNFESAEMTDKNSAGRRQSSRVIPSLQNPSKPVRFSDPPKLVRQYRTPKTNNTEQIMSVKNLSDPGNENIIILPDIDVMQSTISEKPEKRNAARAPASNPSLEQYNNSQKVSVLPKQEQALRAARYSYEKAKSKVRKYEGRYPNLKDPTEDTRPPDKDTLFTAFNNPDDFIDINPAIGSGSVYKTSATAKDDKLRIQLGRAPKGVISNKFNVYSAENITEVDLTDADQYFGNLKVYFQGREKEYEQPHDKDLDEKFDSAFTVPFLRGATTFAPKLPPPNDKNYSDYRDDIITHGVGNKSTCIHQALGQATYRAAMTNYQLSLNQSFYLVDSTYYQISTKADASPMTTPQNPKIAMFYKPFLETDDSWEHTIPGGNALYHHLTPPKGLIEQLMKVYASSSPFGTRLEEIFSKDTQNQELNEAFKNLQLNNDTYDMIKHTMASFYVRLITSIADMYLINEKWEDDCLVGTMSGYPAGLIMPCHLYYMMSDRCGSSLKTDAEGKKNLFIEKETHPIRDPRIEAVAAMRSAFFTNFDTSKGMFDETICSRLYKDGTEWLASQTPCKADAVAENYTTSNSIKSYKQLDYKFSESYIKGVISEALNYCFITNSQTISESKRGDVSRNAEQQLRTVAENYMLYLTILPYIGQNLKPVGTQIFQTWNIDDTQIMKAGISPGANSYKRKSQARGNWQEKSLLKKPPRREMQLKEQGAVGSKRKQVMERQEFEF